MLSMDEKRTSSSSWFCSEAELPNTGSTSLLLPLQQEIWLLSQNPAPKVFGTSILAEVVRDTLSRMAAGLGAALVFMELSQTS